MLLSIALNLEVPSSSSYGVTNSVVIQYTNTGTTAAPAPVLVLSADNANMWLPTDPSASGANLQVLATNPDPNGPAGTLAPGASGSIVVDFTSTTSSASAVNFSLGQLTAGQTIDWASLQAGMQPSYITTSSAWNAVFANFTANVGSTTDSYQAALDADATYLAQIGEPTNNVAQLVAYEIAKADNDFGTPALGGSVDLSVPTPSLDLSITRSFQPTVSGRNETGLFGLGWVSNWDIKAGTDSYGNVTINEGGELRYFALQSDGSYLASAGDSGILTTLSSGGYQLTEIDGSLTTFNANGTLNYIQDSNGNRITAGYNSSGQLVSLTESDGDALTLTYNSQGFVSQVTDSSGETASYTYDAAGHLLSVTTPQGTTTYSYVSGTGTPAENALQTILNPDGTQINYTYDNEGRLTDSFYGTVANPIESVTLSYLAPGGVTYTDANGNKTTVLYTDLGQAAVITDPLGNVTTLSYDASGDLTNAVLPGGTTYSYTYDLNGDLLSETNALGNTTTFTYDTKGDLTSYTDPNGNTTSYAYNSNDDLLSVTYANGAQQSYTYNPLGEATSFLNADGQAIGYSYNTQGQLTQETFANGTSYTYTYDADGNLTSATDAQGNVTKFIYGGDPNNPNNPDLLTEVEYPDGTYLKFSYYAGGERKQSVDQTGYTVNYTYDAADNLTELTDGNGNVIVKYTYNAAGNLIQQDNGNGTRTVSTYDAAGNVLSITNLAPNHTTVNSFDNYTYDSLGNVLTDTNQDGQWVYSYDADSQLVQAVFTPNSTDPDGLTAQNIQYAYDAAGNRISETVNGVTTTYAVNNVNEYTSSTTNGVTTTYQYDLDGNLIAQTTGSSTTNYTYNELSQLTGINGPGLTDSYVYDPLGNRVSQTINGATTNFQIDPVDGEVVAAFSGTGAYNNSGGLLAHYTYGLGLVSQVGASGTAGYYDFGLTGNTIGITNAAGSYVNKYSYLPFGQTTAIAAALPNPFTFVGEFGVMQDASNLFDMRAREYAPATGQFLSNDPNGLAAGDVNIRRYAFNNPEANIDPTGQIAISTPFGTWNVYLSDGSWGPVPSSIGPESYPRSSDAGMTTGDTTIMNPNFANSFGEWGHEFGHFLENQAGIQVGKDGELLPAAFGVLYGFFEWDFVGKDGQHYDIRQSQWNYLIQLFQGKNPNPPPKGSSSPTPIPISGPGDSDVTPESTATTENTEPGTTSSPLMEGIPATFEVWTGSVGGPVTSANVQFTHTQDSSYDFSVDSSDPNSYGSVSIQQVSGDQYGYIVSVTVTFPEEGEYGVTVTVNGDDVVEDPDHEAQIVYDAPVIVTPIYFTVPADGQSYNVPVANITDLGPANDFELAQPTGTYPVTVVQNSGNTYTAYATVNGSDFGVGQQSLLVGIFDSDEYGPQPQGGAVITVPFTVTAPGQPQVSTSAYGQILQTNSSQSADPPLAILDTTDPSITSASQVGVTVSSSGEGPIPLVTDTTLTQLSGGVTQIVVNGVVSTVQPGAGPMVVPLTITLGNEAPLTTQVEVNETSSDYIVNPVVVNAVAGQPLQNVQVATLSGPANGSYSATINWGDGDTSAGVITALGGGQFSISGSKPHPYAATGNDTITVTVTGPGTVLAPSVQTLATVTSAVSPSPSPSPSPPPSPPAPPPSPPAPPPSPSAPPPSPSPANSSPPALSPLDQLFIEFEQIVAEIEAEIEQIINTELAILSNILHSTPKV